MVVMRVIYCVFENGKFDLGGLLLLCGIFWVMLVVLVSLLFNFELFFFDFVWIFLWVDDVDVDVDCWCGEILLWLIVGVVIVM